MLPNGGPTTGGRRPGGAIATRRRVPNEATWPDYSVPCSPQPLRLQSSLRITAVARP